MHWPGLALAKEAIISMELLCFFFSPTIHLITTYNRCSQNCIENITLMLTLDKLNEVPPYHCCEGMWTGEVK
jgi:hypothetical protein